MIDTTRINRQIQKAIDAGELLRTGVEVSARDIVRQAGNDIVQQARRNLRRVHGIDTGATFQNIVPTEPRVTGKTVTGTVRAGGSAANIEYGRQAGRAMPPRGALLDWLARHSIPVHAEFAVRRAIARRGIPPRPFMAPAVIAVANSRTITDPPSARALVKSVERMLR